MNSGLRLSKQNTRFLTSWRWKYESELFLKMKLNYQSYHFKALLKKKFTHKACKNSKADFIWTIMIGRGTTAVEFCQQERQHLTLNTIRTSGDL